MKTLTSCGWYRLIVPPEKDKSCGFSHWSHLERWQMIEIPGEKALMGNEMAETAACGRNCSRNSWETGKLLGQLRSIGDDPRESFRDLRSNRSTSGSEFYMFYRSPELPGPRSWTGTHHLQWNIRCTRQIPRSAEAGLESWAAESGGMVHMVLVLCEFMKTLVH